MNIQKIFFAVLSLSLFITSCSKSTELSDSIPADAVYIVNFDNKALIEKSEYDIFQNPVVQQGINMYKAFLRDQDKVAMLDEFLKDPNSIGLDVKKDFYFYTNYKTYGFLLGVNDSEKFRNALLKFLPIKEEDILKEDNVYTISPESMVTVAWDKNKLLFLVDMTAVYGRAGNDPASIDLKNQAIDQIKQDKDNSINSVKSFAGFIQKKKDISVFYNLDGMGNMFNMISPSAVPMEKLMPLQGMVEQFKGVSMGMYTSFEKGEVKVAGEYYYDSDETEKKFKDIVLGTMGDIKGDQLKYVGENPLFVMSTNMKGEGIYQYLTQLGFLDLLQKEISGPITMEQVEQLIKNVEGDFTFAVTSLEEKKIDMSELGEDFYFHEDITQTVPNIMLFAEMKDANSLLSFIKGLLDEGSYAEVSSSVILYQTSGMKFYIGVNDNTFFVTNSDYVYENLNNTGLNNYYAGRIKNKMMYMGGELESLKPYVEESRDFRMLAGFINEMGKYEIATTSGELSAEGKLEFKNKDKNSLAVICQQIDSMISNIRSPFGF